MIEDKIKQILGEQQFQIAVLVSQLSEAKDKIKELEAKEKESVKK